MVTLIVISAVIALLYVERTFAHSHRPHWLPEGWYRLGVCETGLNWNMHGSTYSFAFGFYNGTWEAYRPHWRHFPHYWQHASPRQQLLVARRVARRAGLSAWGCYTRGDSLGAWVRAGF